MTSDTIEQSQAGLRKWLIWSLGAMAFGIGFFLRVSPSAMVDNLMRDFSVGAAVLGNLSAIYFYVYAGLQIPIGALMDRWGPRLMITISIGLAGIGAFLFASAETVSIAYIGRFLIGAGSACAFVGSLILAGRWFPPTRFALLSGLTMLAGMLGGILGQAPLAQAVTVFGWRSAIFAAGIFAVALAVGTWVIVRDRPDHAGAPKAGPKIATGDLARNIGAALGNYRVWLIAMVGAAFSGQLLAFGGLWGVPYLMTRYGLERPDAAFFVSFNLIGWAIGAPIGGWLSDRIGRRKSPLLVAGIGSITCLGIMFYTDVSLQVCATLIFIGGLISGAMVIVFALAREVTAPTTHGAVTGFINTGAVGAGALLQPAIGILLDANWDGTMVDGVRAYSVANFHLSFTSLIAWVGLGIVCILFTRETYCRPQVV